jgi:hypothetical protein
MVLDVKFHVPVEKGKPARQPDGSAAPSEIVGILGHSLMLKEGAKELNRTKGIRRQGDD